MRTTVTLDPDVAQAINRLMHDRRLSFKAAINEAVRRGLGPPREQFVTQTASLGRPNIDLDDALQIAAEMEDAALVAKIDRAS